MAKDTKSFDNDQIRQLAEILTETGLSEIELERDGLKIRVAREISATYAMPANMHYAPATAAAPVAQPAPAAAASAPAGNA
ncbi:MAG: acetyl-CoA carboxylase, biotin carboxyl carrier protein, partial [Anderseniella sp.]